MRMKKGVRKDTKRRRCKREKKYRKGRIKESKTKRKQEKEEGRKEQEERERGEGKIQIKSNFKGFFRLTESLFTSNNIVNKVCNSY